MRLIDADALMEQVKAIHNAVDASRINQAYNTGFHSATSQMQGLIVYMPTIDAKPVVHGEWKQTYRIEKIHYSCDDIETYKLPYGYCCSICSRRVKVKENFCPNCGADMRERICI